MKKLFSVLAVLLVATALFAQVGLTVKAGGAFGFANYKSVATLKDQDGAEHKWEEILADKALILKENGFGFDVGVQYDISDKLLAYADFNMLFPKDAKTNTPGAFYMFFNDAEVLEKYYADGNLVKVYSLAGLLADLDKYGIVGPQAFKDTIKVSAKHSFFSVSAGAAYKLDFNAIKLNVGGGVTLNKAKSIMVLEDKDDTDLIKFGKTEYIVSFTAIGLNAMVEAKYMVADNIGVGVTLMPQLGLYSNASMVINDIDGDVTDTTTLTSKGFALSFAMPIVVGVSYTF